jgi:hypothetical protein
LIDIIIGTSPGLKDIPIVLLSSSRIKAKTAVLNGKTIVSGVIPGLLFET